MSELTIREAIATGLREALDNDPKVFMMGEDIGAYGGPYAVTRGFFDQYGPERIRDTPISESVIVGAGVGAAMAGLHPIVELMTINFSLLAADQIVNHAAKIHYMTNGQYSVPLLIRTVTGGGAGLGPTHSQSFEGWYSSIPGLKVVAPSTPIDALGLLRSCLKDNNPVLFCEHALLYGVRGEVPSNYYEIPLGSARIERTGTDLTIICYGKMVGLASEAAKTLSEKGIETEVIDLRSLRPIDTDSLIASVEKTHRCLVLDEMWKTGALGTYIAYTIQKEAFDSLDAPVAHLGGEDVPSPFSKELEDLAFPTTQSILKTIEESFGL
jgi:pyruvate dehydrogenase E1 component beta subunit